jgi:hypothetical protein
MIKKNKRKIGLVMTKKEIDPYVTLICTQCEFFKEDDFLLECAAFKVLKTLLKEGRIKPEEIKDASR